MEGDARARIDGMNADIQSLMNHDPAVHAAMQGYVLGAHSYERALELAVINLAHSRARMMNEKLRLTRCQPDTLILEDTHGA